MTAPLPKVFDEFARFGLVGVANTLISAAFIFVLAYAGLNPYLANAIGYVAGTLFSFYANARWTFAAPMGGGRFWRFIAVILVAYCVNMAVLMLALALGWGALASQVPAMICFTLVNFAGQRQWTFRTPGGET